MATPQRTRPNDSAKTTFRMTLMLAVFLLAGLSACEARKEKNPVITTGVVNLGHAGDFPAGSANTAFLARYGIVVVNNSGTPLAIRPQCTHAPCTLKWDAATDQFLCPCHGCRFDLLGRVTRGPATQALPGVVAQRQADGTLTVDLGRLYGL